MTDDELFDIFTTLLEGEVAYHSPKRRVPYWSGSGVEAAAFAVVPVVMPLAVFIGLRA